MSAGITAAAVFADDGYDRDVSYATLQAGRDRSVLTIEESNAVGFPEPLFVIALERVEDPAAPGSLLTAPAGHRAVVFRWAITDSFFGDDVVLGAEDIRLRWREPGGDRATADAILVRLTGAVEAKLRLGANEVFALFFVPAGATPERLTLGGFPGGEIRYHFR